VALAGSIVASTALAPSHAIAQSNSHPSIAMAATIPAEGTGPTPLPIAVGPPATVPANSFIRVRGLPSMAGLSEGHSIAPGAWAIAVNALPNLKITLPAGWSGRSDIVVTLVSVDGSVLAEARTVLTTAGGRQQEKAQGRLDPPPSPSVSIMRAATPLHPPPQAEERAAPSPSPGAPKPAPQEKERAQRLMAKGDEQLASGDVASARLLYERAADAGHAPAAMALAATFDASELERLKVRGIAADPKAARRWYERARELGAAGAEERLRRLGAAR
jgi:hypothetical protein